MVQTPSYSESRHWLAAADRLPASAAPGIVGAAVSAVGAVVETVIGVAAVADAAAAVAVVAVVVAVVVTAALAVGAASGSAAIDSNHWAEPAAEAGTKVDTRSCHRRALHETWSKRQGLSRSLDDLSTMTRGGNCEDSQHATDSEKEGEVT